VRLWCGKNHTARVFYNACGPIRGHKTYQTDKVAAKANGKTFVGIGVAWFCICECFRRDGSDGPRRETRVSSQKIQKAGLRFELPELEGAALLKIFQVKIQADSFFLFYYKP